MHSNKFLAALCSLILLLIAAGLQAQPTLASIFSDHMVLQREKPIQVWGWGKPNEKISVAFKAQTITTKANKDGKWQVQLAPEQAGGPFTLEVSAKSGTVRLVDVLVGEVWLCSGQSNMEWSLSRAMDADKEIAAANYPQIRHFEVEKSVSTQPQPTLKGSGWKPANPENAGSFTAVGYFFARKLHKELGVPIGLIHSSWGGSHVETWTSRQAFENSPGFAPMIQGLSMEYLDSLSAVKLQTQNNLMKTWEKEKADAATLTNWNKSAKGATNWKTIKVPGYWEAQGLTGLDGVVLMRYEVTLTAAEAAAATRLQLGMIDDNETTYVNGVKVGASAGYNLSRDYELPKGLLKSGVNTIAVEIEDTGGGGGFYSKPEVLQILTTADNIPLAGNWEYIIASVARQSGSAGIGPNDYPTLLYNAMIHPLIPFTIQGAIWYQGESNTGRAYQYRKAFPLMIEDWRSRWAQGDFPFYFVQLATYFAGAGGNTNAGNEWAELREAQTLTLSLPNTGMAVTTDVGNPNDIHPTNKQTVGERLALQALTNTYGKKEMVASGPVLKAATPQAGKMVLSFNHLGSGLMAKDKYGYLHGFEIAGADQKYHWAKAMIEGNQVVVYAEAVPNPVAVRYGWTDDASEINLFNKEGLPAAPFRTDNWPRTTEGSKFMQR